MYLPPASNTLQQCYCVCLLGMLPLEHAALHHNISLYCLLGSDMQVAAMIIGLRNPWHDGHTDGTRIAAMELCTVLHA